MGTVSTNVVHWYSIVALPAGKAEADEGILLSVQGSGIIDIANVCYFIWSDLRELP